MKDYKLLPFCSPDFTLCDFFYGTNSHMKQELREYSA
jgi:hypothetical protein